ncbi:MAG: hypothetical protein NZ828_01870 [Alphaproteobacteria bacterium]|nr:hypothetical protein [Alphaproteobacteria bacterium]
MSTILTKLYEIAQSFNGTTMPKDAFKQAFQQSAHACYGLPDDYENEIKFCSNKSVSAIQKEIQKLFSTDSRHDSDQDGFFVVENSAEENNYYLTSIQVDSVTKDENGDITDSNAFQKNGHQMRVRLAFHPNIVEQRANKENQKARRFKANNVMGKFGASQIYGDPEVSVKTLLSQSENQERGEFEVFLKDDDYAGTILREKGHALEPKFKNKLEEINSDPQTELCAEAICMTRRIMFYGAHYVAKYNAYVGYECTIDSNQFADVELRTAKKYSDREMEFEAHYIYPADGRALTQEEQKEILDASTESLSQYIADNTKSFKPSWGSKMERASAAARKIRDGLSARFKGAAEGQKISAKDTHPCLALQRHPGDLLQNNIGKLYEMSLKIDSPVCEDNSADWIVNRRTRKEFVEPPKQ